MTKFREVVRKFGYYYRAGGVRSLLCKCGAYLRDRIWSETDWIIYELNLSKEIRQPSAPLQQREIGLEELTRLPYFKGRVFPEEMDRRLTRRNSCHGFFVGGCLATVGWVSTEYLELDKGLNFPCPGGAGIYDCFTIKEFRSRGYYTNALIQMAEEVKSRGARGAYIAVDPNNIPSVKGIEKAGFRPLVRLTRRRRLGATFIGSKSCGRAMY